MSLFLDNNISMYSSLDSEKIKLLHEADQLLKNQISFTHEWDMERCDQQFLFEGNWEMDPINDPEWTWMLNRCRFIEQLGLAYYITRNIDYAHHAQNLITQWITQNHISPKHTKTVWRRIDTGIRIVHWIKALEYMQDVCSPEFTKMVKESLHEHGKFLVEGLSNTSYTSNWGVLEFHGLFCLALTYDFSESPKWLELSLKVLQTTLECQVLADGVQWERSPMYHNEVLTCYLQVIFLAHKLDITLVNFFKTKVEKMVFANLYWQKPNGNQVLWGDSDDTNLCQLISVAGAILGKGEFKQVPQLDLDYHFYFSSLYEQVKTIIPMIGSHYLQAGGLLTLKDDDSSDSSYLSFITKNFGGGHSHSDLLHISYYANNKDYLIDCGRLTYTETADRKYLKSSQGHNTIIINDKENTLYKDSWSTSKEARFVTGTWETNQQFDWAYSHDLSYLTDGVFLTRNIIRFGKEGFLLLDLIQCNSKTNFKLSFNTPRSIHTDNKQIHLEDLILHTNLDYSISKGICSYHYNSKQSCNKIIQEATISQNTIIANFFTFKKHATITEFNIIDRKNREVASHKAKGFSITIGDDSYTILYKIEPSAKNSGFFLEYKSKFYMNSHILLKNNIEIFNF